MVAAVSEPVAKRDGSLSQLQRLVGARLAAIGNAVSLKLKEEGELFGGDLGEVVKIRKILERSGQELKAPLARSKVIRKPLAAKFLNDKSPLRTRPQGAPQSGSKPGFSQAPHYHPSLKHQGADRRSLVPPKEGTRRDHTDPAWVVNGGRKWHKMKSACVKKQGKLAENSLSEAHKAALQDYCHFVTSSQHVDVVLKKSDRNLAIKNEEEHCFNKQVLLSNDVNLRPYRVTYLRLQLQNEFIDMLDTETEKKIIDEIKEAKIYTVVADTTPGVSHHDQLSLCVRYV
ncbi:hypothetical protein ILUMI_01575 [Ignelater luminosus]|uniref:Uncharacterized protein n=1 Tax=Ignelater luminosus TaxID=2038154 RepID=A0A8K0GP31_IGNLU|nr:hypothetical protein ILUMI_01575 [Ignelater luminosus]